MPSIPLAKGEYERGSNVPAHLVNMLYEDDPTNQKDQVSLLSRPGYDTWSTIGTSPIRLMSYQRSAPTEGIGPFIYVITNDANLYKVGDDGVANQVGSNGQANYQFVSSSRTQMLLSGTEMAWSDGATITPILTSFMDSAEAGMCWVFGGYGLVLRANSERFYWSSPGDVTTWDALDFASAESLPDTLSHIFSIGDFLYLGGSRSIEPWSQTGNADAPFTRLRGRVYGCGISGGLAIYENEVAFFVGGVGSVWMLSGELSQISPEWVDQIVNSSTIGKAYAYSYDGHALYVLNGTDAEGAWTLVYDVKTRQWFPWRSHNADAFEPNGAVLLQGRRPILSSSLTGKLYEIKKALTQDNGNPIVRLFTGLVEFTNPTPILNIVLECSVGMGSITYNPQIEFRYSRDRGKNWTSWRAANLGREGEFAQRVSWTRLGVALRPGMCFEFRYAGDTEFTVRTAVYNERGR